MSLRPIVLVVAVVLACAGCATSEGGPVSGAAGTTGGGAGTSGEAGMTGSAGSSATAGTTGSAGTTGAAGTMFPNTKYGSKSNNWYWASHRAAGNATAAWAINFDDGFTGFNAGASGAWNYFTEAWVKCVR